MSVCTSFASCPWIPSPNKSLPLRGEDGGLGRLRPGMLLSSSPEEGVEGLGHDARGARGAVSASADRAVAGPALCVRHVLGPRGKSENLTIPFPFLLPPQGLTVSNSTHNAGSQKANFVEEAWLRLPSANLTVGIPRSALAVATSDITGRASLQPQHRYKMLLTSA